MLRLVYHRCMGPGSRVHVYGEILGAEIEDEDCSTIAESGKGEEIKEFWLFERVIQNVLYPYKISSMVCPV